MCFQQFYHISKSFHFSLSGIWGGYLLHVPSLVLSLIKVRDTTRTILSMRILFWRAVFESLAQWEGESCELGGCVVEEARKGSSEIPTWRQLTQQLEHLFTPGRSRLALCPNAHSWVVPEDQQLGIGLSEEWGNLLAPPFLKAILWGNITLASTFTWKLYQGPWWGVNSLRPSPEPFS